MDPRNTVNAQCDKLANAVGRMSTVASIVNVVWPATVDSLSQWPSTFVELSWQHVATIDVPWRNFLSPEYGTKFQREVPLFWRYQNFLKIQSRIGRRKLPCQKTQFDSFIRFDRTPTCNSHRHRTTANTALAQRRAVKKSNTSVIVN